MIHSYLNAGVAAFSNLRLTLRCCIDVLKTTFLGDFIWLIFQYRNVGLNELSINRINPFHSLKIACFALTHHNL